LKDTPQKQWIPWHNGNVIVSAIFFYIPKIAVTTSAELAAVVATTRVDEGVRAVETCLATFDEGAGAGVAPGIDAAILGTIAGALATAGGATIAEYAVAVQFKLTTKVVVLVKMDWVRFAETVTAGRTGGISVAYSVVVSV
jgi:hypothetical protein